MAGAAHEEALDPIHALALKLRAAKPRGTKLGKEQKQFNKLVRDIDALRSAITRWQAFEPRFRQRLASEVEPLIARYRASRLALVMLLKAAIDGKELGKREKAKAAEILCWHLSELLEQRMDEDLIALYDQYAERSYAEERALEAEQLIGMADAGHDMEFDEEQAGARLSEEELARRMDEHRGRVHRRPDEPRHAQLAEDANDAVRQIYRRLASELHPDREADADQRTRKTVLMQQANQAYAESDLLTLLGLQLQVEQLDPANLTDLARDRLRQYNHLLAEQCEKLHCELLELTSTFGMAASSPEMVERALEREARDYKLAAQQCESDVAHFRQLRNIKDALDQYRLGDLLSG